MLQNATPLRKSAPWPPNISDEHVFCTAPATENASLQILFKCPMPAILFGDATKPSPFAHFWQGAQSLAPATRNEIWMSKSGPHVVCCVHFDFEMCFVPQRRALFRHLNFQKWSENGVFCTFWLRNVLPQRRALFRHRNFQKWSEHGVFCTFWLRNVLRATTACTFSTSQLPKVVRTWCVCTFWLGNVLRATMACTFSSLIWPDGSAPAALASLLRATNHWKTYLFAHLHLLSSDSFSSIIFSLRLFSSLCLFPISAFHLSILSEVWLLNFLQLRLYFKKCPAPAEPVQSLMVVRLCLQFASARKHLGISQTSNDSPIAMQRSFGLVALQYTQRLHR